MSALNITKQGDKTTENLNLEIGKKYFVTHINNKKKVKRIYKGTEQRFGNILCFVFTAKVNKDVKCTVTYSKSGDIKFFKWSGVGLNVPNEISIPYYDLRKVEPSIN